MSFAKVFVPVFLLLLSGCRSHVAHVYSGVDPNEIPLKTDAIVLELPDGASIRERNVAVLLKEELARNGFNIVSDYRDSKWTLSFAVDRRTYTIGSTSHGMAIGFGLFGAPMAVGSSSTSYVQQTDVSIFMHLLRTNDIQKPNPMAIWEGSVTTKDRVFAVLPNATIKNLLEKFGQNFERRTKVDKSYQRAVNAEKAGVKD